MAVDTRDKRASVLLVALPFGRVFPDPDGAMTQPDRQQMALCYAGILAAAPVALVFRPAWTFLARERQYVFPATRRGSVS